jgi:hypothetical protein
MTSGQIAEVVRLQETGDKRPFGDIAFSLGYVDAYALRAYADFVSAQELMKDLSEKISQDERGFCFDCFWDGEESTGHAELVSARERLGIKTDEVDWSENSNPGQWIALAGGKSVWVRSVCGSGLEKVAILHGYLAANGWKRRPEPAS